MQAVHLIEPRYEVVKDDILATGALPSSGGLLALHARLATAAEAVPAAAAVVLPAGAGAAAAAAAAPPLSLIHI